MAIRFPKMSIAASTVNRILNVADELASMEQLAGTPSEPNTPALPGASPAGQALDAALSQPPAPVDAPDLAEPMALRGML